MPDIPDSDDKDPRIAKVDQRFAELQRRLKAPVPASWEVAARWKDLARQAMELLALCVDKSGTPNPNHEAYQELLAELAILEEITK